MAQLNITLNQEENLQLLQNLEKTLCRRPQLLFLEYFKLVLGSGGRILSR